MTEQTEEASRALLEQLLADPVTCALLESMAATEATPRRDDFAVVAAQAGDEAADQHGGLVDGWHVHQGVEWHRVRGRGFPKRESITAAERLVLDWLDS